MTARFAAAVVLRDLYDQVFMHMHGLRSAPKEQVRETFHIHRVAQRR